LTTKGPPKYHDATAFHASLATILPLVFLLTGSLMNLYGHLLKSSFQFDIHQS
jgi:hypothetical protein